MDGTVNVSHLSCLRCGRPRQPDEGHLTCPDCGAGGLLEVQYDYTTIARTFDRDALARNPDRTMWRYEPFLPVPPGSPRPHLAIGGTPMYRADRLGLEIGLPHLWIKDDGLNPTGSLKDRASAIAVAKALETGQDTVACASTGNAASSLAGNAANAGLKSVIFVSTRAPAGKIAQLLVFGATVISVEGTYVDAFALSERAIADYGWYNRNAAINPYLVEGKKTVALEIAEQFGWNVPDWVVVSVGDGCTIAGVYKGFYDLLQVGWIDRLPRLLGVQAEGCAPICRAFVTGGPVEPSAEDTLADSIAVGYPRNPDKALRAVKSTNGAMITVADADILDAMRLLGRTMGIFGEPAGVAGMAGLRRAVTQGLVQKGERVTVVVTGNGLKDTASAARATAPPIRVSPDPERLHEVLAAANVIR